MLRYFCSLIEGTNKAESGACVDSSITDSLPENYPYEISEEVFNNLHRAEYVDGEWVLGEQVIITPEPPQKSPEQLMIEQIQSENADLTTRLGDIELALADIFTGGGI